MNLRVARFQRAAESVLLVHVYRQRRYVSSSLRATPQEFDGPGRPSAESAIQFTRFDSQT